MKETCMNCGHRMGCLMKGALIFMLYIQTGRSDELPHKLDEVNVRMFCKMWMPGEKEEKE